MLKCVYTEMNFYLNLLVPEAATQKYSWEEVFWKYAANFQEKIFPGWLLL